MSTYDKKEIKQEIEKYKNNLQPKNGNKHIILIETEYEPTYFYNQKLNEILDFMQKEKYEILDVKLEIFERPLHAGGCEYETIILYK